MALTSLEAINQKLEESRKLQLEDILRVSGSFAIAKNEYGVTVVDEKNVASSLLFKPLNKPKIDNDELIKAVDINLKELKPVIPDSNLNLVPKPVYDTQVKLNADLTKQINTLNKNVSDLSTQVTTLQTNIDTEINNKLNIEQSNNVLSNQISALQKTIDELTKQIQTALQKSVEESVLRASLQSQNAGYKSQIEALVKQIDSLNSIIEGLQAQLGGVQQKEIVQSLPTTQNQQTNPGTGQQNTNIVSGDKINDVADVSFTPTSKNDIKVSAIFGATAGYTAGSSYWLSGENMFVKNNDTADITLRVSVNYPKDKSGNGIKFFAIDGSEQTIKPGQTGKVVFRLVDSAVKDLHSKKEAGNSGGFSPSNDYTGGSLTVSITKTSNNTTKDKTYGVMFSKNHPSKVK